MNNDYDEIEEDLKKSGQSASRRKEIKKSGRSVFKLQEIIKEKAKDSKEGNGDSPKAVGGDE